MQSWRLQINLNQGCTTTYVTVVYLVEVIGVLIEKYEEEHVPELTEV